MDWCAQTRSVWPLYSVFARFLFVLIVASLASACAGRAADRVTVHVFSNQPDHPQLLLLVDALEQAGHQHSIRYQETPGGLVVGETVMATGAGFAAHKQGLAIAGLVQDQLGSQPRLAAQSYGNHRFTAGNIGLYVHLAGEGGNARTSDSKLQDIFAGTCRGRALDLMLFDDGRFQLELNRWRDGGYELEHEATWSGRWGRIEGQDTSLEFVGEQGRWRARMVRHADQPWLELHDLEALAGCSLIRPL